MLFEESQESKKWAWSITSLLGGTTKKSISLAWEARQAGKKPYSFSYFQFTFT